MVINHKWLNHNNKKIKRLIFQNKSNNLFKEMNRNSKKDFRLQRIIAGLKKIYQSIGTYLGFFTIWWIFII